MQDENRGSTAGKGGRGFSIAISGQAEFSIRIQIGLDFLLVQLSATLQLSNTASACSRSIISYSSSIFLESASTRLACTGEPKAGGSKSMIQQQRLLQAAASAARAQTCCCIHCETKELQQPATTLAAICFEPQTTIAGAATAALPAGCIGTKGPLLQQERHCLEGSICLYSGQGF